MIFIFFIFPFLTYLWSLLDLTKLYNKIIFVLFYGLFGYCNSFDLYTSDIYRIGLQFQEFSSISIIEQYKEGILTDIYFGLMTSIISVFTSNAKVFLGVLGLIFGFLNLQCILILLKQIGKQKNLNFFVILFVLICNISLVHFTGVRFFTAALFAIWGTLEYLFYNNKRFLICVLLSPLIHFGMFYYLFIVILYLLVKPFLSYNIRILYLFFVITFLLSFFNLFDAMNSLTTIFSSYLDHGQILYKMDIYSSLENDTETLVDADTLYRQANQLFTNITKTFNRIGIFISMTMICRRRQIFNNTPMLHNVFVFILFLFSCSFLAQALFSSGGRFITVASEIFLIYLGIIYSRNSSCFSWKFILLLLLMFIYPISFLFFNAPRLVTPWLWVANVPYLIYNGADFIIPVIYN